MGNFILDEWLWADLCGENGPEKQLESEKFLAAIYEICDRIIHVKSSQFEAKALKFLRHSDSRRRKIAKFYAANFLYNFKKSELLDQEQCKPLPDHLSNVIDLDDTYIVQAHLALPDTIIITTDTQLMYDCTQNSIPCKHRDEFVHNYLSQFRGT
jgi:hypothetical protein